LAIAADNAACATRALVIGRAALASSSDEPGVALAGLPIQTWIAAVIDVQTKKAEEK
jgi:hypothetical protein